MKEKGYFVGGCGKGIDVANPLSQIPEGYGADVHGTVCGDMLRPEETSVSLTTLGTNDRVLLVGVYSYPGTTDLVFRGLQDGSISSLSFSSYVAVWTDMLTGSTTTDFVFPYTSGAANYHPYQYVQTGKDLLIARGKANSICHYNGTTSAALTGANDYKPKFITYFYNRVIIADISDTTVNCPFRIRWSEVGSLTTWTGGTTGFVDLIDGGDAFTGLVQIRDRVLLLRSNSVWVISHVGGDRIFAYEQIAYVGCIAPRSVVVIDNKVWFIARQGVVSCSLSGEVSRHRSSIPPGSIGNELACGAWNCRSNSYVYSVGYDTVYAVNLEDSTLTRALNYSNSVGVANSVLMDLWSIRLPNGTLYLTGSSGYPVTKEAVVGFWDHNVVSNTMDCFYESRYTLDGRRNQAVFITKLYEGAEALRYLSLEVFYTSVQSLATSISVYYSTDPYVCRGYSTSSGGSLVVINWIELSTNDGNISESKRSSITYPMNVTAEQIMFKIVLSSTTAAYTSDITLVGYKIAYAQSRRDR